MVKKIVMLVGAIFLVLGGLGFVPAATSEGLLLGIFEVGTVLSTIYLVSGVLAILFASRGSHEAKNFAKIFGVLYAFLASIGLIYEDSILGYFSVNPADNWLHVVIALVLLGLGFFGANAGHDMRHRTREELES